MSSGSIILLAILLLVIFLIIGIPIPFAFSGVSIVLVLLLGYQSDFLIPASYNKMNTLVLLCIPLFIIAGGIIRKGKIGDALIDFVGQFVNNLKSGLGIVTVITCAIFGALSGSSSATLSSVGSIMGSKLEERGYPKGIIAALLASSSVLGLLIPPSAAQILYAWSSGTSVLACFLATIIPGIIVATFFCIIQYFQVRKLKSIQDNTPEKMDMSFNAIIKRSAHAIPALLMPIIVLGSIYGGVMTTMEAAAVAVFYCVPIAVLFYKGMQINELGSSLVESAYNSGAIMMMLMSCGILSRIFTTERVPDMLVDITMRITTNKTLILIMINIVMIVLGMLMDDGSVIVLSTPLLLPIATSVGVNSVHYAAIMGVNLGMGLVTPPCAPMLYLGAQVAKTSAIEAIKPTLQYILFAWLPALILTTFFPELSLWLPRLILGRV